MAYYPFATEIGAEYALTNAANSSAAVFNNQFHPLYSGMLTEVSGLDSPDVRESAEELAQADGGSHGYFYFGRRPIVLNSRIFGHTSIVARNIMMDRIRRASLAMRSDSVLSWKPSIRRENLVTNPRAQTNTTDWFATGFAPGFSSGAALTRQTGLAPPTGTTGFQIVTTGTGSTDQGAGTVVSLQAGKTYAWSFSYRRTAGTGNATVKISSQFAGGGVTNLATNLTSAAWATVSGTFTPSATDTYGFGITQPNSNTAASTFQFSDIMIGEGTDATYRDGDTAGWFWQGDVGNSASGDFIEMFTYVRRQAPLRESGEWVKEVQIPLVSEFAAMYSVQAKTLAVAGGAGLVAENRGSWPASPILRITGASASNPTITGTGAAAGTVINTTGSLLVAAGETIEIDTLNHTATFIAGPRTAGGTGNANSFINFATTIWPTMPTGSSTFTLSGTGTLTAVWRDTWM